MTQHHLLVFVLTLVCLSPAYCLFNSTPTHNFTISPFNSTIPPSLIVEGSGTKFMIWSHYPSHFQIYSINGTPICSSNSSQTTFEDIIWPLNHPPIVSASLGGNLYIINQTTCSPTYTYNIGAITKKLGQIGNHLDFYWKENRSILTVSGYEAVYQIDLNSSELIKSFSVDNGTNFLSYHNTLYSKDLSHLFALTQNLTEVNITLNIWENNNETKPPANQIKIPSSVLPGPLSNLKESNQGLLYVLEPLSLTTTIYTFNASGNLTKKLTRPYGGVIAINDGNLFDTVAISDPITNSLEIAKLDNGQTLQRIYFPITQQFESGQYKNRVMVLLDKTGNVLVYSYDDDILPPKPDDGDDSGQTTWIIIASVLVVVLVIGGAVFFYSRKKKLAEKSSGTYGKISDQV